MSIRVKSDGVHTKIFDAETGAEIRGAESIRIEHAAGAGLVRAEVTLGLVTLDVVAGARFQVADPATGEFRDAAEIVWADGSRTRLGADPAAAPTPAPTPTALPVDRAALPCRTRLVTAARGERFDPSHYPRPAEADPYPPWVDSLPSPVGYDGPNPVLMRSDPRGAYYLVDGCWERRRADPLPGGTADPLPLAVELHCDRARSLLSGAARRDTLAPAEGPIRAAPIPDLSAARVRIGSTSTEGPIPPEQVADLSAGRVRIGSNPASASDRSDAAPIRVVQLLPSPDHYTDGPVRLAGTRDVYDCVAGRWALRAAAPTPAPRPDVLVIDDPLAAAPESEA